MVLRCLRKEARHELAKLDFNIKQTTYQQELKDVSRWWSNSCLAEKLPFVRDRIVECYFWAVALFEPHQYEYHRKMAAIIITFVTIIDDVYDVYGTLNELQLFTDTIRSGYTPSLEEYLNNAKVSISSPTIISQLHFTLPNSSIDKRVIESLYEYHNILNLSGMILRLADDLGTTQFELKRGDVPKAIQCYMKEKNVSEKEAQEHVRFLLREAWKEMNTAMVAGWLLTDDLAEAAANLGRAAQFIYLEGDGHGVQHSKIHQQIDGLLFDPYV
ncbi:hypothetical protein SASPL_148544 [Salvia splendens]|uniref:Terpene synthase metal-binding domain-containing protein n=1 Tax=Salvia splendens TaxID=180675 RepID=A0A8X8WAG4_SALSN|nr:hypothetical protein SASPL_148544 [Salvia splendens]